MNRFYIIVPVVLLVVFGFLYHQHSKSAEVEIKQKEAQVAQEKAAADAKKAEAERKAKEDADKRTAERIAADKKKEDDKRAKWEAEGKRIADDTQKFSAEADTQAKLAAKLELDLNEVRAAKEKANRESFELLKAVERARIDKRNAELEVQRMTEMVSRRAAESAMARLPAAPAAPAKS